jgi:hypothetical protein
MPAVFVSAGGRLAWNWSELGSDRTTVELGEV